MSKTVENNIVSLATVSAFVEQYSLATIVYAANGNNLALRSPFIILPNEANAELTLYTCINASGSLLIDAGIQLPVLCIFDGPYGYVSASWAEELVIPDWVNKSLYIEGTLSIVDVGKAADVAEKLIAHFEGGIEKPSSLKQVPKVATSTFLQHKTLLELTVTNIVKNDNLYQTVDEKAYLSIIRELKRQSDFNSMLIAFEMEQELKKMRRGK